MTNVIENDTNSGAAETPASTKTASKLAPKTGKKAKGAAKTKAAKAAKAKPARTARKAAVKAATARDGSKKATILALLRRKNGATLTEIMKATGWQAHSVRGFISGAVGKQMGLTVESAKRDDGERVYTLG